MRDENLATVSRMVRDCQGSCVALTGAGISVESGIPDFRSAGGIWDRYDIMEYGTIQAFRSDPIKVWSMLKELDELIAPAQPNPAHAALARLEQLGLLRAVITQNIDNLHQAAGSKKVVEFHGNGRRLVCLQCRSKEDALHFQKKMDREFPPRCPTCKAVLKPDVVLFGEAIPAAAAQEALNLAQQANMLLVIGTSATVAPANALPLIAYERGATVVEINLEQTQLSQGIAHFCLQGRAGEILPALIDEIETLLSS
jgi:NAD-dependent deacetylase